MNILFIYSLQEPYLFSNPVFSKDIHFGISYISSFLKQHGHATGLVVLSRLFGKRNHTLLNSYITKFRPQLICFTAVSTEYSFIADMARYIKSHWPGIYLLIGGPHASLSPENILQDTFDALCIGEGEYPTCELVRQLEENKKPSGISNLWIKDSLGVEKNPVRPFLQDLDTLPFADRDLWQGHLEEQEFYGSVLLGRGCPFQCTYCCNSAFGKLAKGEYVRLRSVPNIMEEIRQITQQVFSKKIIYLEIETITVNKEWTLDLCAQLAEFNVKRAQPVSFGVNLRITPGLELEDYFKAFKKSNFKFVCIGVESGSQRVRSQILNRHYSNEDIINAVRLARQYGLEVHLNNLIGVPGETPDDFRETVKINRLCAPDKHYTCVFFPYPGTDLYFLCKKLS